ncbi:hypothetical protein SAMN05216553_1197 [Lentzea fradiae]|uniref:Peptidoglycan binding domain-containing protein n=1 Tax=Lentzea fradiae TaxID=200378 RepID=A0A1G8BD23_9PSEU|nr:hypothetical protein [Lentzea fradiae]SDH30964.1 hypothetical protein SAMN05216553_1197 [Lentzea fradiae]
MRADDGTIYYNLNSLTAARRRLEAPTGNPYVSPQCPAPHSSMGWPCTRTAGTPYSADSVAGVIWAVDTGRGLAANTAVVTGLQRGLIQCCPGVRPAAPYSGEFVCDLDRDGSFGPRTEAAVKGVQTSAPRPTGSTGPTRATG